LSLAGVGEASPRHLTARATIHEASGTWHLELTTEFDGMAGERRLASTSCRALADAATLTLALILNPEMTPPSRKETPPHDATPPVTRDFEASSGPSVHGRFAIHAGAQTGILKHAGPELGLGAGISIGRFSGWVVGAYAPRQLARVSGTSGPGGRIWAGSVGVHGCWDLLGTAVELGPCLGAEIDRVQGWGTSVSNPARGATTWLAGVVGIAGGLRLSPIFFASAGIQGCVPVERPALFLQDIGDVQRPERVGGRARVSAGFVLP
jgi:hypothetical protein